MAIEIYNVVLQPEIIVGVGPLVRVAKNDPVSNVYGEHRIQFDLYCEHYRITITTDPLSSQDPQGSKTELGKIRQVWETLRCNLANDYPMETGFPTLPKSMPGV